MDNQRGKIAIIGQEQINSQLYLQTLREKYGDDIVVLTDKEAQERNINIDDVVNIPSLKITASPEHPALIDTPTSGREKRRERRKKQRKNNKKWK